MWTVSRPGRQVGRFAELYAGALDRLGDPMPHQRMGALCTFEALGDDYPEHVQAIVDVLCAYGRSSSEPDAAIRTATLRLLTAHLRPGPTFWSGVSLNLAGARLTGLDLSDCRLRRLNLDAAVLAGPIALQRMAVSGAASFRQATFATDVWFEHSVISGPAHFDAALFHGDAWFGGVRFLDEVSFAGANLSGHAWFSQCDIAGPLCLDEAVFRRSTGFRGAVLRGPVSLSGTTFLGPARVSRLGDGWNIDAPGWGVAVDQDNEAVGHLLWLGAGASGHQPTR